MTPITFRHANITWAKDQPPYLPLPAFVNDEETISCWSLTWRERLRLLIQGHLWLRQKNLGHPLQAQCPTLADPFVA